MNAEALVSQLMKPAGAELGAMNDCSFMRAWEGMPMSDKLKLPDRAVFFERYQKLTPYVGRSVELAERAAAKLDALKTSRADVLVAELSKLDPIAYGQRRADAAKELGVTVGLLDQAVSGARHTEAPEPGHGTAVALDELEPWPEPVDAAELLGDVLAVAQRFAVLPEHTDVALALWVTFTHTIDAFGVAPILALTSPEKRCGKSTVLGLLGRLVHRPLHASNITPAATFRAIEQWHPTLLIDEADTFLRENEELRGVLNSGHTRATAFVVRTVGDDHEPRQFSTWGAKAIAKIGVLPETLADRAIAVELRRRLPGERTEKLRHADQGAFEDIKRKLTRFALDRGPALSGCRPTIPEILNDRAADNWEPLLAIAELAGAKWPDRARAAALAISGFAPEADSLCVQLLTDIRQVFLDRGVDRIGSSELTTALADDETRLWAEYNHGKPISQRQLSRLLSAFSIVPCSVRLQDGSTPKGYRLENFEDAFARYLPPLDPPHRHKPAPMRVVADSASATEDSVLRIVEPPQTSTHAGCGGVADPPPLGRPYSADEWVAEDEDEVF